MRASPSFLKGRVVIELDRIEGKEQRCGGKQIGERHLFRSQPLMQRRTESVLKGTMKNFLEQLNISEDALVSFS